MVFKLIKYSVKSQTYLIGFADNLQTDRITRGIVRIHNNTNTAHKGENDQHAREIQPDCPKTEAMKIQKTFKLI